MTIRPAVDADWPIIWALFRDAAASGDVFAYDEHTTEETARKLWFEPPAVCFVAEVDGRIVGTYYVRPNQPGRGGHVANGGYIVAPRRGGGASRGFSASTRSTPPGERGFTAMQFNYVVATNTSAVRTWEKCGFAVVGRLPGAFRHRELGAVDVLVMFRDL